MNHTPPILGWSLSLSLALCGCTQAWLEDAEPTPDAPQAPDLAPPPAGLSPEHPLADDHLAGQLIAAYLETVIESLAEDPGEDAFQAGLQPALRCAADPRTGGATVSRALRGEAQVERPGPDGGPGEGEPLTYTAAVALDQTQTFLPGPLGAPITCNQDGTAHVGWWQADRVEGLTLSAATELRGEHTLRGPSSVISRRVHGARGAHSATWARPAISTEAGVATLARTLTLGFTHTLQATGGRGQDVSVTSRLLTEGGASLLETVVRTPGRPFISKTVERGTVLGLFEDGARVSLRFDGVRLVGSGGRRCLPVAGVLAGQITAPSGALHKTFDVSFPLDATGSATIRFDRDAPRDLLLHPAGCSL